MKKFLKSALAVSLCFIMFIGTIAIGGDGFSEVIEAFTFKASAYSTGDYIYYGTYPQTDVTSSLGSVLNSLGGTWKSYGYYSGTGNEDGQMKPSDYMLYKDVSFNGNKYRAVFFDSYRPASTSNTSSADNSKQDDNGYTTGNVYWFKYEPIKWRILDPSTGLIMCDIAIDSQAYNNWYIYNSGESYGDASCTYYDSNYAKSSIRTWLNDDFYNTAFSDSEKFNILKTELDNSSTYSSKYDATSTTDKVFLLSYADSINSKYGFSSNNTTYDTARQLKSTDYAKSQGCSQNPSASVLGNCWWWLRSPVESSSVRTVFPSGKGDNEGVYFATSNTTHGVVPALRLQNLESDTIQYTVSYNANGGSGAPASQTKTYGTTLTLSNNKPTRTGYTFLGWSTNSSATTATYPAGGSYTTNESVTLYAIWEKNSSAENIYNLGEETYSFKNYGDSDSYGGHCFGMSSTSAGYHIGKLNVSTLGISSSKSLYSLNKTSSVLDNICHYQAIQGSYSNKAIVAGGSTYITGVSNIKADWNSVRNYVKSHNFDGKGSLQIGFRKNNEGGHAINFLRYEVVNGQERIYAYDNNFPNEETYFYMDSNGKVYQAPKQTFSGSIDCICLRDMNTYFQYAGSYDSTRFIYGYENVIDVENAKAYPMEIDVGYDETLGEFMMFEVPDGVKEVKITPLIDNAVFLYCDEQYKFSKVDDSTEGSLVLAKPDNKDEASITIKTEKINIANISKYNNQTVDYKTSITFHAKAEGAPKDSIVWYVDGKKAGVGDSYTVLNATSNYSIFFTTKDDVGNTVSSEMERINVKTSFLAKLVAFFRGLFGLLPSFDQ